MAEMGKNQVSSRRRFITRGAVGAGIVAVGAGAAFVGTRLNRRAQLAAARDQSNPFAYDVTHLAKTDPSLIHYEEVGRLAKLTDEARRLAVWEDRLFIAAGNYVRVLNEAGGREVDLACSAPPRCLAISEEGTVFVGLRDHLELFDQQGQRRAVWDSPGPRTWFTGVAIGPNDVFAADAGHRVVLRYDRSGKLIGRIGEKNKAKDVPGFVVPSPFFDVELARDGLLRVANPGRHRIEAYTFDGDLEWSWGKASAAIEGFCGCCNPVNFVLLADGRYVTCEKGLPRVKTYRADGTFESVVAGPESFSENLQMAKDCSLNLNDCSQGGMDVAVDARGRIYVLDMIAGDVRIWVSKGSAAKPETAPT